MPYGLVSESSDMSPDGIAQAMNRNWVLGGWDAPWVGCFAPRAAQPSSSHAAWESNLDKGPHRPMPDQLARACAGNLASQLCLWLRFS
ncbi:unnamed protein product [Effrenium voratum]|nr:unnamed protein product [Effrenium voratum]